MEISKASGIVGLEDFYEMKLYVKSVIYQYPVEFSLMLAKLQN